MTDKPFDLLNVYSRFAHARNLPIGESATLDAFLTSARDDLGGAVRDEPLIHGHRTAAMFEALVLSLDRYKMFKVEDIGRVHSSDKLRAPDFRVILEDGEQWLIEVKNVWQEAGALGKRRLMSPAYYASLAQYSALTGAKLKLAVYWSSWRIWTLVSPEALLNEQGYLKIDMRAAVLANELSRLGDVYLGTRSPITMRLETSSTPIDANGQAEITITGSAVFSEDRKLSKPEEAMALLLVQFGEWEEHDLGAKIEDNRVSAIEFQWRPRGENDKQDEDGFAMIGSLSRMYAAHYLATTTRNGRITQIEIDDQASWFSPLNREDQKTANLPLWRFVQQPNHDVEG